MKENVLLYLVVDNESFRSLWEEEMVKGRSKKKMGWLERQWLYGRVFSGLICYRELRVFIDLSKMMVEGRREVQSREAKISEICQ